MLTPLVATPCVVGQPVTLRSTVVGETPRIIGLNSGNYMPSGNAATTMHARGSFPTLIAVKMPA